MPSKSKRVASRQAQLSGRGKRARPHGPPGIPTQAPSGPITGGEARPREEEAAPVGVLSPRATSEGAPPWRPATSPRSRGRGTPLRPAGEYFRAELRRVGLVSALVFGVLIVLFFVLR